MPNYCWLVALSFLAVPAISWEDAGQTLTNRFQSGTATALQSDLSPTTFSLFKTLTTVAEYGEVITAVAISPKGNTLVSSIITPDWYGPGAIKIWDLRTGQVQRTIDGRSERLAISSDGQTLVSGGSAGKPGIESIGFIEIWNLRTGESLHKISGNDKNFGAVNSIAISPDGQILVSGSELHQEYDKTKGSYIQIWNLHAGQIGKTLQGHTDAVTSVAISPDGQTLVSGSKDKTIKVWNLNTDRLLHTLKGHTDAVTSVAISPDSQTLVSGSKDKTVKVWNLSQAQLKTTLKGHTDAILAVAINPDGQTLTTSAGFEDKTIKIWNLHTGKVTQTIPEYSNAIAFSRDGQTLVTTSPGNRPEENHIKIWSASPPQGTRIK